MDKNLILIQFNSIHFSSISKPTRADQVRGDLAKWYEPDRVRPPIIIDYESLNKYEAVNQLFNCFMAGQETSRKLLYHLGHDLFKIYDGHDFKGAFLKMQSKKKLDELLTYAQANFARRVYRLMRDCPGLLKMNGRFDVAYIRKNIDILDTEIYDELIVDYP